MRKKHPRKQQIVTYDKQVHTRRRESVQQRFVLARHIHGSLMHLGRDTFVTVLSIEGMSYDLKSPAEQRLLNELFQQLLAGLNYPIQICWRVLPLNLGEYLSHFAVPGSPPGDLEDPDGIWRLLSSSHESFLSQLASQRTLLKRTIYLVVRVQGSMPIPQSPLQQLFGARRRHRQRQAQILEQARQELDLRANELMRQLAEMNLAVHRLRGPQELIPFYYSCLTPMKADAFPLSPAVIEALERPVQALPEVVIAARPTTWKDVQSAQVMQENTQTMTMEGNETALDFAHLADLVAPSAMVVLPDCLMIEKDYARVLVVHNLPRTVGSGWLRPLAELDEPMEVSFHLQPRQSAFMIQQFRRRQMAYHSTTALAGNGGVISPEVHVARTDVDDLLLRLASGEERVLSLTLLITLRGTSKRLLDERTARVQAVLHSMLLVAREALFEQDKAFRSCLPHGQNELSGLLLDSRSASTLFPFLSNSLFHADGILEGVTPQGDPVILNAWSEDMANANRIILGPPGWGKSHSVKTTLIRQVLKAWVHQRSQPGNALPFQTIIIDPEREYRQITSVLGGQMIRLAPGSSQHLNPFDLPVGREDDKQGHGDRLADHVQKLHTLLEIMLADRTPDGAGTLSSDEKGLLDRAIYECYRKVGITSDPTTHTRPAPLMRDLYEVLESGVCGSDERGLMTRLRRYVHGSLAGLFAGPSNISLDRMIITFDIYDLETELRPIGLFLVSNFVWTRSFQSRIPRQLIVDEAATLTQYVSGAQFLEDLVRRARKHFLGVTVISQHANIFQKSAIPANCATHVLMRQDATSLDLLEQMFKLSSRELHLLQHLGKGEALLLTSEKRLHIRFAASDMEHVLATTDPREIARWHEDHPQDMSMQFLQRLQRNLDSEEAAESVVVGAAPRELEAPVLTSKRAGTLAATSFWKAEPQVIARLPIDLPADCQEGPRVIGYAPVLPVKESEG